MEEKWSENEYKLISDLESYKNNFNYQQAELEGKNSTLELKNRELNKVKLDLKNLNSIKSEVLILNQN